MNTTRSVIARSASDEAIQEGVELYALLDCFASARNDGVSVDAVLFMGSGLVAPQRPGMTAELDFDRRRHAIAAARCLQHRPDRDRRPVLAEGRDDLDPCRQARR